MKRSNIFILLIMSLFTAACASAPPLTGLTECVKTGDADVSFQLTGFSYAPENISSPTQSLTLVTVANGDCSKAKTDSNGKPLWVAGHNAQGTNLAKDVLNTFAGTVPAAASGLLPALVLDGNGCNGKNCGLPPIVVNNNAMAGAQAGSESSAGINRPCGTACAVTND